MFNEKSIDVIYYLNNNYYITKKIEAKSKI